LRARLRLQAPSSLISERQSPKVSSYVREFSVLRRLSSETRCDLQSDSNSASQTSNGAATENGSSGVDAAQVTNGGFQYDPNSASQISNGASTENGSAAPLETFQGNDSFDPLSDSVQNASASTDLPAEVAPASGSTAFQDAVQQADDVIDNVDQSVSDNLLGNENNGGGNFGESAGNNNGGDNFGDDGDDEGSPIVLDVAGLVHQADHGIKITQLSSSNTFFDMTGSGRQNPTAWAGAGNGVLFFDATGQGQLTQQGERSSDAYLCGRLIYPVLNWRRLVGTSLVGNGVRRV
jgi:hypothetical protein